MVLSRLRSSGLVGPAEPDSPSGPGGSRLRGSGLALAAAGVAALASGPLTAANATIVDSGPLGVTLAPGVGYNPGIDGSYYDINSDGTDFFFDGKSSPDFEYVSASSGIVAALQSGDVIGSTSNFSTTYPGYVVGQGGQFVASTDAYMGFEINPSGSLELYGWIEFAVSADGQDLGVEQLAYNDSGAPIAAGDTGAPAAAAVPEPGSLGLLASSAGAMTLLRRRRGTAKA